jgi:hypothetical protein
LLSGEDVLVFEDAALLEAQSAHAEQFVIGQALDENALGFSLGLVLCCEAGAAFAKFFFGTLVIEEVERLVAVSAETVCGAVAGRSLLA